ncbi:TPA: hypothetical protein KRH38_003900 [Clostridioides difficile]|uniref:hypothetical protein n=1 Tax=Clostridioides difficile TaxID=1496 RepID=UPI001C1C9761|nr:hypothetical protein [Clostridioides difficile]
MEKIDMDQVRDYRLCLLLAEKQSNNRRFNSIDGLYLRAVKQNGYALEYVREQTEEMCIEAVKTIKGCYYIESIIQMEDLIKRKVLIFIDKYILIF